MKILAKTSFRPGSERSDGGRNVPDGIPSIPDGIPTTPGAIPITPDGIPSVPDGSRNVPIGIRNVPSGIRNVPNGKSGVLRGVEMKKALHFYNTRLLFFTKFVVEPKNYSNSNILIKLRFNISK